MSDEITNSVERGENVHRIMQQFGKRGQDYLVIAGTARATVRVANLSEARKAEIQTALAGVHAVVEPWDGVRGSQPTE